VICCNDIFFLEGQEAYYDCGDWADCPYPDGTDGEYGWHKGWHSASKTPDGALCVIGCEKL
jgi:hypothetical protein